MVSCCFCLAFSLSALVALAAVAVRAFFYKSHLAWLVVNMLVYGYNDGNMNADTFMALNERAEAYQRFLCGIKDSDWAVFRPLGLCLQRAMTPEQINAKYGLQARYVLPYENDPPVMVVEGLLTPEECDIMTDYMVELGVADTYAAVDTGKKRDFSVRNNRRTGPDYRASHEDAPERWPEMHPNAIMYRTATRVAAMFGADTSSEETPNMQLTGPGEYFHGHHDFSYHQVEFLFPEGPRTWTSLIYLNDPSSTVGGATRFSLYEKDVKPRARGGAVFWPSHYEGTLIKDYRTWHAGTPVESGEKFTYIEHFRAGPAREDQEPEDDRDWVSRFYASYNESYAHTATGREEHYLRRFASWWRVKYG